VRVTKVDVLRNQIDLDIVITPEEKQQDESAMPVAVNEG
jgi:ribonuclease R